MAAVFELLTLPASSDAFTAPQYTVKDTTATTSSAVAGGGGAPDGSQPHTAAAVGPVHIEIDGSYREKPDDGTEDLRVLSQTINAVLARNEDRPLPDTYEGIYNRCMYVVCVAGKGETLYDRLKISVEQCTGRLARELLEAKDKGWIALFTQVCEWFETQVFLLRSLLIYLNQIYVRETNDVQILLVAFNSFQLRIFDDPKISDRLRRGVEEWIDAERRSKTPPTDRRTIAKLIRYLLGHKQYSEMERHFLELTLQYYEKESATKADEFKSTPEDFFKHVTKRIEEEVARAKDVLFPGSWDIVRQTTERALLNGRLQWLAKGTLPMYFENKDKDNLYALYKLYGRVDAIAELVPIFKHYVKVTVQAIVDPREDDEQMIPRLIEFRARVQELLAAVFVDAEKLPLVGSSTFEPEIVLNQEFVYALTDAFAQGFKARRNKPAEMLAKHLDRLLKRGQRAATDEAFLASLDAALALYRFTDDRDVFRTFYQRLLAKRLLLERSASDDFELTMLKKLKDQHDPEFGMSEDMFRDLRNSREHMAGFHEKLEAGDERKKLSAMVLQRSAWPFTVKAKTIDLPLKLQKELDTFSADYSKNHPNRKLDWDHALGSATLTARFNKGTKDLTLSLYQTVVLLMFNDRTEIPFTDIQQEAGMEDVELRRTLQSLACGKKKVLKKIPAGRDVNDGDKFVWNADFTDEKTKVHIPMIQTKVTEEEESRRTHTAIDVDRKHLLDAAIVRIMKAKKEMYYENLKIAVIDAVKAHFDPDIPLIKKRVDALVEQEYLERSEEDHNKFVYLA